MANHNGMIVAIPGAICGALFVGHIISNQFNETIKDNLDDKQVYSHTMDSLYKDSLCKKAYLEGAQKISDSILIPTKNTEY